jgi:hypothetical protein
VFSLTVSRTVKRRINQNGNVKLFAKAVQSCPHWKVQEPFKCPEPVYDSNSDSYIYAYKFVLFKKGGKQKESTLLSEWAEIVGEFERIANAGRWHDTPWILANVEPAVAMFPESDTEPREGETQHALTANNDVISLAELKETLLPKIDKMLEDEGELRSQFAGIFNREPQIRTVLSSIKSFLTTDGQRRNHVLLYGLPACAKTQILLKLREVLGDGAVVRLDATSTTSAGIYKLFFNDLETVPPFVFIEEIEKTAEDALRVWLGALDDRGELRKMNFRDSRVREVKILCLATANDKQSFDKLMGGSGSRPGALSSRFVNQLYCSRPDDAVLKMILERDIHKYGGDTSWIEPALKLAKELNTNDPRKVLALLDGGSRLLDGSYQDDIKTVVMKETEEMHTDPAYINTESLNKIVEQMTNGQSGNSEVA